MSHLPNERRYARVVGHGMNAAELARNPRLDEWFVRDLNKEPSGWAAPDGSFDAVLCTAGLQYLQQPEAVLAEVRRVLKPGGIVIIAFSNRMFYEKVRGLGERRVLPAGMSMRPLQGRQLAALRLVAGALSQLPLDPSCRQSRRGGTAPTLGAATWSRRTLRRWAASARRKW